MKNTEPNRIVVGSIVDLGNDPYLEYKMDKFFYDYEEKKNKARKIEPSFLDQDDSCHWYIIPEKNRAEWDKWRNSPDAWDDGEPLFAERIDGHPRDIVFWRIDDVVC